MNIQEILLNGPAVLKEGQVLIALDVEHWCLDWFNQTKDPGQGGWEIQTTLQLGLDDDPINEAMTWYREILGEQT